MLLYACIFSGCDYLDSLKGIGFKKAVKLVEDGEWDLEQLHEVEPKFTNTAIELGSDPLTIFIPISLNILFI